MHEILKQPFALLSNHASLAKSGVPLAVEMKRMGLPLMKLFTPEHGLTAQAADGAKQDDFRDPQTGLQTISLYGEKFIPSAEDLSDVEVVLMDLPNIGVRFYTYLWTMSYMLEACAAKGKSVVILDRINWSDRKPEDEEGPFLDESNCASFLGRWRMPLTFSSTFGALLERFNNERGIRADLRVVSVEQCRQYLCQDFIPPSPAIPDVETARIYPCTALFEGLNVSHGRGTTLPFKLIGAPWIDNLDFYQAFKEMQEEGINAFPYQFTPQWGTYQGESCKGLYFSLKDHHKFRPVSCAIHMMNYLGMKYPEFLAPHTYPTYANRRGEGHLDLLMGEKDAFNRYCKGQD